MRTVVKRTNLLAFKIWLAHLGYQVREKEDGRGFNFRFKKQYGMVTRELKGNELAHSLGKEFEEHLKA